MEENLSRFSCFVLFFFSKILLFSLLWGIREIISQRLYLNEPGQYCEAEIVDQQQKRNYLELLAFTTITEDK